MNHAIEASPAVEAILAKRYPSYQEPLRCAWTWNREALAESLKNGEELARALKARYPNVLQVRYELSFSLVRQKRRPEAIDELKRVLAEFPAIDEDCLSLLGRCHKDEGDSLLEQGLFAQAEREYRDAEASYERAYELRHDRFPGVNTAGLRLIRASLLAIIPGSELDEPQSPRQEADRLVALSEQRARDLLASRETWVSRLPDDNIWIAATEAEAHLLLQEWELAAKLYRQALSQPNRQPFHAESMQAQYARLMTAFGRLKITPPGSLAKAEILFTDNHAANTTGS